MILEFYNSNVRLDSFISVWIFEVPHFIYYLIILCDKFLSMFPPDQLPKEGQFQC